VIQKIQINLLGELPHPLFGVAASDLYGSGEGKLRYFINQRKSLIPRLVRTNGKLLAIVFHILLETLLM